MIRLPKAMVVASVALLAAAVAIGASIGFAPREAEAHPLGNFTINHFTRIEVSETGIVLYRVLEMAEIPTFQEYQDMDTSGDGAVDGAESDAWIAAKTSELRDGMRLAVNGEDVALQETAQELTFLPGDGSLQLLRFAVTYQAPIPADWRETAPTVEFEDSNYTDRIGWREVVVRGSAGVAIAASTAPETGISNELLGYPADYTGSPPDVRTATFSVQPGAGSAPEPPVDPEQQLAVEGNPDGYLERFSNLIAEEELTPGFVSLAILAAMGFGAVHALGPGHGKTVVAAYLVGSRGTAKHALLLGMTVTATHTSSVYLIGLIALYLSEYIVPEDLYPWMEISSGAIIVAMGALLLVSRLRASGFIGDAGRWTRARLPRLTPAPASQSMLVAQQGAAMMSTHHSHGAASHAHGPSEAVDVDHHHHEGDDHHDHDESDHADDHADEHTHEHPADDSVHKHGWGPSHSHAMPGADGEPVSVRQLIGLGIFGGMIPCPSAIVVMLSAVALHRVGFGLVLIVAFSLGLAGVLTGIGLAMVYARTIGERLPIVKRITDRAANSTGLTAMMVRVFPIAAAAFVAAAGMIILARGAGRL